MQNICLFLKTIKGLVMCFSWKIIEKCSLFNEAKKTTSENLYFPIFRYSVQMQMYVYAYALTVQRNAREALVPLLFSLSLILDFS